MTDQSTPILVGLGEALWDCFDEARRPGGAPANVAYHASLLGLRGVVCSRVGRDELGQELLEYLADHGLDTRFVQRDSHHETGRVTVDHSIADRPAYTIHENVAWDHIEFDDDLGEMMAGAAAVCFGTLAQRNPASRAAIHKCLDAACDAVIVYDVNLRPPWYQREWIENSLGRAHIVKLNADEVDTLAEMLGLSRHPDEFAAQCFDRYRTKTVCVTRGERGCRVCASGEIADVPGEPVKVADAVGAGDAFTAAFIFGTLQGWPLDKVARFANRVGGLVASQPGAMPDVRDHYTGMIRATLTRQSRTPGGS